MIQSGEYTDVKLNRNDSQMMLYHHTGEKGFRILTMHQNGAVMIKVKPYPNLEAFISDKSTKVKYPWSGSDFVRIY